MREPHRAPFARRFLLLSKTKISSRKSIFSPPPYPRNPPCRRHRGHRLLSVPPCCVQAHASGWTGGPCAQLSTPPLAASGLTSSLQCFSWYPRAWCATSVPLGSPPCPADSNFPPRALAPQRLLPPPWHAQTLRRPAVPPVLYLNSRAAQLPSHSALLPPPAPPQPLPPHRGSPPWSWWSP